MLQKWRPSSEPALADCFQYSQSSHPHRTCLLFLCRLTYPSLTTTFLGSARTFLLIFVLSIRFSRCPNLCPAWFRIALTFPRWWMRPILLLLSGTILALVLPSTFAFRLAFFVCFLFFACSKFVLPFCLPAFLTFCPFCLFAFCPSWFTPLSLLCPRQSSSRHLLCSMSLSPTLTLAIGRPSDAFTTLRSPFAFFDFFLSVFFFFFCLFCLFAFAFFAFLQFWLLPFCPFAQLPFCPLVLLSFCPSRCQTAGLWQTAPLASCCPLNFLVTFQRVLGQVLHDIRCARWSCLQRWHWQFVVEVPDEWCAELSVRAEWCAFQHSCFTKQSLKHGWFQR